MLTEEKESFYNECMVKLLVQWVIKTFILLLTTKLVPGFTIESWFTAFTVALVLGIFNVVLRPILVLLTLPVTILTLGLFLLIINGGMLLLASSFVPGFHVDSLWTAIISSIVISLLSLLVSLIFDPKSESSK